jgi:hypothetical protein
LHPSHHETDEGAGPLDKRAAFERMGVRLDDALISKHDAYGSDAGGPSREDLVQTATTSTGTALAMS